MRGLRPRAKSGGGWRRLGLGEEGDIDLAAMRQGIADQVIAGAEQHRDAVERDLAVDGVEGQQGAPGGAAVIGGRRAAEKIGAGSGMDAIGADQGEAAAVAGLAVGFLDGDGDAAGRWTQRSRRATPKTMSILAKRRQAL